MKTKFGTLLLLAFIGAQCHGGTITYNYDRAGRLRTATFSGGKSISYTYDAAGNQTANVTVVPLDADGDGMADSWETTHFGNTARNGSGDFDNDGQSDLAEYLAGTLPNNAASALRITTFSTSEGQSATVQWASVSNRIYRLEYKDSIGSAWIPVPGEVTATSGTASKTDANLPLQVNRFYRITLLQ